MLEIVPKADVPKIVPSDGEYFNKSVQGSGAFSVGQMELYDVGFASMFVQARLPAATSHRSHTHTVPHAIPCVSCVSCVSCVPCVPCVSWVGLACVEAECLA